VAVSVAQARRWLQGFAGIRDSSHVCSAWVRCRGLARHADRPYDHSVVGIATPIPLMAVEGMGLIVASFHPPRLRLVHPSVPASMTGMVWAQVRSANRTIPFRKRQ